MMLAMDWFDERFAKFQRAVSERDTVSMEAEEVYSEVWKSVLEVVKKAKANNIPISVNGSHLHYKVILHSSVVEVRLRADRCAIEASFRDNPIITLALRVCEDGTVCIRYGGKCITQSEAARVIMERLVFDDPSSPYAFLFPDV
jgi:hypothetical protein